ncbi:MAG: YdcF family protein [Rhizobiaceae bacterium]|jgi:uncharacterized SAM-binding protein YcdF (DUF218 family)
MDFMDIDAVSRCFFPPDCQDQADIAIVFGMSAPTRPVSLAVDLFHSGRVPKLLFTGGYNKRLGCIEAIEMARLASESGVPADAILIEDKALNTEENVEFSYRILKDLLGFGGVRKIMLLTIHYHLRRAHIAARHRFPPEVALYWKCYGSLYYTSANWFAVERGRQDVVTEIGKIEHYYGLTLDDLTRTEG